MKTDILFRYLAQFFLEWEMFQIKPVEKIETHISCSVDLFRKLCRLRDNLEKKYFRAGLATDDNMAHTDSMLDTYVSEHTLRMCNTFCFSLQQWLPEHAFVFRYTYIACLVLGNLTGVQCFGQPHCCSLFWVASFVFSVLDSLTVVQCFGYPHLCSVFLTASLLFSVLGTLICVQCFGQPHCCSVFWAASQLFCILGSLTIVLYFGQPHFRSVFWGAASLLFNFLGNLTVVQFIFTFPVMKNCCVDWSNPCIWIFPTNPSTFGGPVGAMLTSPVHSMQFVMVTLEHLSVMELCHKAHSVS